MTHSKKAVVLVSGGLDSATVLAMAKADGYDCYALSMDYGQRHRIELDRAQKVSQANGAIEHRLVRIDIGNFGGSALTDQAISVPTQEPVSVALGWAEVLGAQAIFIGANSVDYSGYPDCRPEYIKAFQTMANLATKVGVEDDAEDSIKIEAPLIAMTKAEIIQTGLSLGVDYSLTISCYNPRTDGKVCHECDSCRIREAGFAAADSQDPAN